MATRKRPNAGLSVKSRTNGGIKLQGGVGHRISQRNHLRVDFTLTRHPKKHTPRAMSKGTHHAAGQRRNNLGRFA